MERSIVLSALLSLLAACAGTTVIADSGTGVNNNYETPLVMCPLRSH